MLKEYRGYIKDNPKRYWFRAKLYGWGWTPATWQGWVVIGIFFVLLLWNAFSLPGNDRATTEDLGKFFARLVVIIAGILAIAWKTGEKPRWQWGPPKKRPRPR